MNTLVKEAPVSLDLIAPIYRSFYGETVEYSFNFADPLAVALETYQETVANIAPVGIQIKVSSIDSPYASVKDTDYSRGIGYGSLTLIVDGEAAALDLPKDTLLLQSGDFTINGSVNLEVTDLSSGGFSSPFTVNFEIRQNASELQEDPSKIAAEIADNLQGDYEYQFKEQL